MSLRIAGKGSRSPALKNAQWSCSRYGGTVEQFMTEDSALTKFDPFIRAQAGRRAGRASSVDFNDLCQEGRMAMVLALRSWNPARGPLEPLVLTRVKEAMNHAINAANQTYWANGEVAGPGAGARMVGIAPALPDADSLTLQRVTAKILMGKLTLRQQRVLRERYWEGRTQEEVGERHSVGGGRVSQIETAALRAMRAAAGVGNSKGAVKGAGLRNG